MFKFRLPSDDTLLFRMFFVDNHSSYKDWISSLMQSFHGMLFTAAALQNSWKQTEMWLTQGMAGLLFPHKVLQAKAAGVSQVRSLKKTQPKRGGWACVLRIALSRKPDSEWTRLTNTHHIHPLTLDIRPNLHDKILISSCLMNCWVNSSASSYFPSFFLDSYCCWLVFSATRLDVQLHYSTHRFFLPGGELCPLTLAKSTTSDTCYVVKHCWNSLRAKRKSCTWKRAFLAQDMINKLCTAEPFLNTNYAQLMHPWSRKKVLHTNKSVFGSHQVNMGLCCWIRTHNDNGTQCKDRSFIFLDKLRQPWLFKKCIIGSLFLVGSCSRNSGFQQPSTNHMNIFIFAVWVLFDYGQDLPKACQNFKLCT